MKRIGEDVNEERILAAKPVIICTIVALLNSFFYSSFSIMLTMVIVEILVLILCMVKGKSVDCISLFMVFLCFSMENASYVGNDLFYGFKNFRIAGFNIALWVLAMIFVREVFIILRRGRITSLPKDCKWFLTYVYTITIIGIFVGLITFLANDNNLSSQAGAGKKFIDACYIFVFVALEVFTFSSILGRRLSEIHVVKKYMAACVPALAMAMLISTLTRNYGNRGGLASLQVSNLYALLIISFLLFLYPQIKAADRIIFLISGAVIILLGFQFNASGKTIILVAMIPVLLLVILFRQGFSSGRLLLITVSTIAILVFIIGILPSLLEKSQLLRIKMSQVTTFLNIFDRNWLANMAESPKMRITEFLNISNELINKPWYLLFGKGFMGSMTDSLNLFSNLTTSSFSQWELDARAYYQVHESLNVFWLASGIYGVVFFFKTLKYCFINFIKSPWLLFGALWFTLFYAFSITISVFGVMAFLVGMFESSNSIVKEGI